MQDRLPPVIEAQSSNWAINRERQTSPKPQLRNTDDSRKLYVSIGYFTNQENLKRTLETIEITGYPKQFTQITISGKAGHWVRIGPFNSQEKASKALEITKSMGFSDAYKISG
jgi:cell division protein FtsN